MSLDCRPFHQITENERNDLHLKMIEFYKHPQSSYYEIADQSANHYTSTNLPFHFDLVERISPAMTVCELGCGTAHLCPEIEKRGGLYTGFDWSQELLRANSSKFPKARFFSLENTLLETFDLVASLYTIEHVVNPISYLEQIWSLSKPGGLMGIICPEFINGNFFPPSFFYGKTPRRLREKLADFSWIDIFWHLVELKLIAPRWKKNAQTHAPGAFWINLKPRVLHGATYTIDGDAVHLPRLEDLEGWFIQKGANIIKTSKTLRNSSAQTVTHSCYILARKPLI